MHLVRETILQPTSIDSENREAYEKRKVVIISIGSIRKCRKLRFPGFNKKE